MTADLILQTRSLATANKSCVSVRVETVKTFLSSSLSIMQNLATVWALYVRVPKIWERYGHAHFGYQGNPPSRGSLNTRGGKILPLSPFISETVPDRAMGSMEY